MFGTRSGQVVMWYGVPSAVFQSTAPVVASSPYTQLFSVVAVRVLPTTSGCPYTEPLTAVEKIWPNDPPLTAAAGRAGSFRSLPRGGSACAVVAAPLAVPGGAGVLGAARAAPAGPLAATAVSPAAETAVTARTENDLRALNAAWARAETRSPSDFISKSPLGRNACATPGGEAAVPCHDDGRQSKPPPITSL